MSSKGVHDLPSETRPGGVGDGPPPQAHLFPTRASGWAAVAAAAVGLGSWIVLPVITVNFRDEFPVTDTALMPATALALTCLAAVVNVLVVWRGRQRSALNVVVTILTVGATLVMGLFLIGEGLGGA